MALIFVVGIFLPVLVDQINGLTKFVTTAAQAPEGPTEYIKGLARQNGLRGLLQRFDAQLADLRKQLGELLRNLFSATGAIAISAAGFVAALATVLTLTFFLILGSERCVNAGVGLLMGRGLNLSPTVVFLSFILWAWVLWAQGRSWRCPSPCS